MTGVGWDSPTTVNGFVFIKAILFFDRINVESLLNIVMKLHSKIFFL
jgi:hypothetical protein